MNAPFASRLLSRNHWVGVLLVVTLGCSLTVKAADRVKRPFVYSDTINQNLKYADEAIDSCGDDLEERGALYHSSSGSTMRTLTPSIKECYLKAYTAVADVYDQAANYLLERSMAAGNLPKCKQEAERIIRTRPDLESIISKLTDMPLKTDQQRLMATLGVNAAGISIVIAGLGQPHSSLFVCAMENSSVTPGSTIPTTPSPNKDGE